MNKLSTVSSVAWNEVETDEVGVVGVLHDTS